MFLSQWTDRDKIGVTHTRFPLFHMKTVLIHFTVEHWSYVVFTLAEIFKGCVITRDAIEVAKDFISPAMHQHKVLVRSDGPLLNDSPFLSLL